MKHVQSDYKLPFNCVVVASPWQQRRNLLIITTLSRYLLQRRNSNRSSDSTSVGSVQVDRIPDVARRARRLRPVPEVGRRHPSERCDVVITWCQCVRCLQPVSSQCNNVPTKHQVLLHAVSSLSLSLEPTRRRSTSSIRLSDKSVGTADPL